MIEIKRFDLDAEHYCVVWYDEYVDSPRNWWDSTKFCIRPHRRYNFPNELNYDWDSAAEDAGKLYEEYYIFELDCYIHSGITFSLSGCGIQCRFDTSKNCGFIAVPKTIEWAVYSEEEAKRLASSALETYNQWLNWEVYEVLIFKHIPPIVQDGKTYTTPDDLIDSLCNIYDLAGVVDSFDSKFREVYLANI